MRKLTYIIFLFYSIYANSQDLVKEGNQWNIAIYPTFSPNTKSYSLKIGSKININDTIYNEVLISNDSITSNWSFNHLFIRQSSDQNQVYVKSENYPETLLYDFNLQLGDKFPILNYCNLEVFEIDTIELIDGIPRKRMKLTVENNTSWGDQIWIKGIGSEFGMLSHFMFCSFDYSQELLCFFSSEELLYPTNPSTCFITNVNNLNYEKTIKVKPIPSSSELEIEIPNLISDQIIVYNSLGQTILSLELINQLNKVDISNLVEGHYIIGFYKNAKYVVSKRFIKN